MGREPDEGSMALARPKARSSTTAAGAMPVSVVLRRSERPDAGRARSTSQGHRCQDDQELEGFNSEVEAQHARSQRQRIEPEAGQRRRERQAVHQPEAASDEEFPALEDRDQGMDGRNQDRKRNGRFDDGTRQPRHQLDLTVGPGQVANPPRQELQGQPSGLVP